MVLEYRVVIVDVLTSRCEKRDPLLELYSLCEDATFPTAYFGQATICSQWLQRV